MTSSCNLSLELVKKKRKKQKKVFSFSFPLRRFYYKFTCKNYADENNGVEIVLILGALMRICLLLLY